MNRLFRRRLPRGRTRGIWLRDYSGGLVPKVKSALSSWTRTGGVTWNGAEVAISGTSQSMQAAFTAPAENYLIDVQAFFPSAANVLTIELLSGISGTVRFALEITGSTQTITAAGNDITPADLNVHQYVRYRLIVRPATNDVICFAYWYDELAPLIVWHLRLAESGGTKAWSYSGGIGALRIKTTSGTVGVRDISVKPIIAVIIGDSISTGAAGGIIGYNPAPYLIGARSGDTHTVKWYVEDDVDADHLYTIVAQGTGGLNMSDTVTRFQDYVTDVLAGMSDKRVLIHAGTNDINDNDTGAQILANLDLILAAASADSIKVLFAQILPRTVFDATKDTHRATFNSGLAARETATAIAALVDTNVPELQKPGAVNDMNPVYTTDGTHPNWDGYRLMGPEWVRVWNLL